MKLEAGAAHRELLADLPAGGAVDSGTGLGLLEGWRLDWPPSPPVYPLIVLTPARLACLVHSSVSTSSQLPILTVFFSPPLDREGGEGIFMPIVQMRRLSHTDAKKTGRDNSRAEWIESWPWGQKTRVYQHASSASHSLCGWGQTLGSY